MILPRVLLPSLLVPVTVIYPGLPVTNAPWFKFVPTRHTNEAHSQHEVELRICIRPVMHVMDSPDHGGQSCGET